MEPDYKNIPAGEWKYYDIAKILFKMSRKELDDYNFKFGIIESGKGSNRALPDETIDRIKSSLDAAASWVKNTLVDYGEIQNFVHIYVGLYAMGFYSIESREDK
jgi:hypothetical protein